MSDRLVLERRDRVATLTLSDPPLNVLDLELLAELAQRLEELAADGTLQALVLRGAGPKAFCAGVSVHDHTPDKVGEMLDLFHGALRRLAAFPAVTIAAIRGHCLGGGMELAACCDLRVAEAGARFGQPEILLGCFPPVAAALFPTLLGQAAACDLLLTGRTIDGEEALRLGFVSRLAAAADLDDTLGTLLERITAQSAAVSRLTVKAIRSRQGRSFEAALAECERIYLEELCRTTDMNEGLSAFLEKRPPDWKHR